MTTYRCAACGGDSEVCYRCTECGRDLASETSTEGQIDV